MDLGQSVYLNWIMQEDGSRQQQVNRYREYYDGNPPTLLTDRMRQFLNVNNDNNFGANICATVVDTLGERLHVTGFDVEDNEELSHQLDEWWEASRMDAVQDWVHTAALRDGEAFVIVEYDPEKEMPVLARDFAYDGTSGVKIHIQPGTYDKLACASKRWVIDMGKMAGKMRRLNLYFPNRIEKWVSKHIEGQHNEAYWQPYQEPSDPTLQLVTLQDEMGKAYEASVSWWTDDGTQTGKPLGVPVIPFRNRDDGTGRGISEIDNIIPLQDALNKTLIDMLATADMTGFQMMYTIDAKEPSGGWKVYPSAVLNMKSETEKSASTGVIAPGSVTGLIELWNTIIAMVAGISATPQSRFVPAAVRPAEGTQKQEESALIAKAVKAQRVWGNAWEDAMALAAKIDSAFGTGAKLPDQMTIRSEWADAQTRNEKEEAETVAIKVEKLSIPLDQAWREVGYSAGEIADFKAQKAKEGARARVAEARQRRTESAAAPESGAMPVGMEQPTTEYAAKQPSAAKPPTAKPPKQKAGT